MSAILLIAVAYVMWLISLALDRKNHLLPFGLVFTMVGGWIMIAGWDKLVNFVLALFITMFIFVVSHYFLVIRYRTRQRIRGRIT